MPDLKLYMQIFTSFFKIGAFTFGGGYAMLPIVEREASDKRGWVSKQELLDYFAMGQTLPGIIAVNVAVFCGSNLAGFPGALAAALGVVASPFLLITLIALFFSSVMGYPVVSKILFGMNIGVAALLVTTVVDMLKKAVIDPVTAVLAATAFACVAFFGVHSFIPLVIGAAAGIALKYLLVKREGGGDK